MDFYIKTENVNGRSVDYLMIQAGTAVGQHPIKIGYIDNFNRLHLFKK